MIAGFALLQQRVTGLAAEMRHVDDGSRIVGKNFQNGTIGKRPQPLARLEHGKRAQQPQRIERFVRSDHGGGIPGMFRPVHKDVTARAGDAGCRMD